ncbi:MAG: SdrD B-like domain-containing protein [Anaerolineales bacterium]
MWIGHAVWILAATIAALATACNFPAPEQTSTPAPAATIIRGSLWHDVCDASEGWPEGSCLSIASGGYVGNGLREGGEPGIEGIRINLGSGTCPSTGLDSTITGADGSYAFVGHAPGRYCVSIASNSEDNLRLLLPGVWSHPADGGAMLTVEVAGGEDYSGVDFGWDYLSLPEAEPNVGQNRVPHVTAVTDTNCRAGPGTVYEVVGYLLEGESALVHGRDEEGVWWWVQLPMRLDDCWVTDVTVNINFSVDELPYVPAPPTPIPAPGSVGGRVWHDECGLEEDTPTSGCVEAEGGGYQANGLMEPEEPGIGGVLVMLGDGACPSTGLAAMITEDDGSYVFAALAQGTYCVSADATGAVNSSILIPGGWTNPPGEGRADLTVILEPGEDYLAADFGWEYQFLP